MNAMPAYTNNKVTHLGWLSEIPHHWRILRLKHVGHVKIGLTYSPDQVVDEKHGTLVLRSSNVQERKLAFEDNVFVSTTIPEELRTRVGDILICTRNGSRALIGKNARIDEASAGMTFGAFMSVFRSAYNDFLIQVFNSPIFEYQSSTFLTATINQLTTGNLRSIEVPFPPLDEQTQIAKFLDYETAKIDALIEKQQQLIELLKEKRQAVISHAVTKGMNPDAPMRDSGVEWLGRVPAHWEVAAMKHHIRVFEQGWSPQCDQRPAVAEEWGVLKVGCVNGGRFRSEENKCLPELLAPRLEYSIRKGDMLISRANTRELVGSAAVVREDHQHLMLCDRLYRIRFDGAAEARFVAHYLGVSLVRGRIELQATGASDSMHNIGQSTIKQLQTPFPPLQEARGIVAALESHLEAVELTATKGEQQVNLLTERRSALISAAVTGKIDVRNWKPPTSDLEAEVA